MSDPKNIWPINSVCFCIMMVALMKWSRQDSFFFKLKEKTASCCYHVIFHCQTSRIIQLINLENKVTLELECRDSFWCFNLQAVPERIISWKLPIATQKSFLREKTGSPNRIAFHFALMQEVAKCLCSPILSKSCFLAIVWLLMSGCSTSHIVTLPRYWDFLN